MRVERSLMVVERSRNDLLAWDEVEKNGCLQDVDIR